MMLTTGISMVGKISVGVRTIASPPMIRMRIDITTKGYAPRNASRTIHIESSLVCQSPTVVGSLAVSVFRLHIECPAHKTRKLSSRPLCLGSHCSLSYSQNLCRFTGLETIQVAQLECSAQRGRKLFRELHEALTQFSLSILFFRIRCAVHQPL